MRRLSADVFWGVIATFWGRALLWHALAIGLTALLVLGGYDWQFYEAPRSDAAHLLGYAAGMFGFVVPLLVPACLYALGRMRRDEEFLVAARGAFAAVLIASIVIAFYKTFTGRMEPAFYFNGTVDNSRDWLFGFFRHGIFWGWPSAHAAVASALSVFTALWYKRSRLIQALSLAFALFIAIGAGVSFHWLSDVIAGVIIGSLVSVVAYRQARGLADAGAS